MINLLPPQEKEELLLERKFRLTIILGVIIFSFLVAFSLFLVFIKISLANKIEIQEILLVQRQDELKTPQIEELKEKLLRYNFLLSEANVFYQNQVDLIEIFGQVSATLPQGSYLTNFNYNPFAAKITLSAFCPDRAGLLEFRKNLIAEPQFEEISFPQTVWLETADINFTLGFKVVQ